MTVNEPIEDVISSALSREDSPFELCDDCGQVLISNRGGGHSCENERLLCGDKPRSEEREIVQKHDPNPPNEIVGYTPSNRASVYHNVEKSKKDPDEEWKVTGSCRRRIADESEWEFDTRENVQRWYGRYPCTICHDLPIETINAELDDLEY